MSAQVMNGAAGLPTNPSLAGARVNFLRVLRSEWRKLFSLRATWIMLSIAVVLVLGFAAIGGWGFASIAKSDMINEAGMTGGIDSIPAAMANTAATSGLLFGALLIAVAFIVNLAGEYNQHTIVSTLSAVPSRTPVYLAKTLLATVLSVVAGVVLHLGAFGVTSLILKANGVGIEGDLKLWLDALVSGLYVAVLALLAIAVSALLRNTAGAIVTVIGIVYLLGIVITILMAMMPSVDAWSWIARHLPLEAVGALRPGADELASSGLSGPGDEGALAPWDAWLTVGVWTIVPLVFGWLSFKTRPVK